MNDSKHNLPNEITLGSYTLIVDKRLLRQRDKEIKLTKKETLLLQYLSVHVNEECERYETLRNVWNQDTYAKGRSMDVFITSLRKYLKDDDHIKLENIRGVGFKLTIKSQGQANTLSNTNSLY